MLENGGQPIQPNKNIKVEVEMDMQHQIVTFVEKEVNGLVMIEPKKIPVPAQTILVIAAQMILSMMGVKPGAAAQIKGNIPNEGPNLRKL